MLAIFTVLHFLVDGICAAAMAAYAVQEPLLAPIVYYFGLYNAIAFGTQWLTGWLFDKKENWIRYAFLFVLLTLGLGTQSALGTVWCCGVTRRTKNWESLFPAAR